jgi:hypothetical protein
MNFWLAENHAVVVVMQLHDPGIDAIVLNTRPCTAAASMYASFKASRPPTDRPTVISQLCVTFKNLTLENLVAIPFAPAALPVPVVVVVVLEFLIVVAGAGRARRAAPMTQSYAARHKHASAVALHNMMCVTIMCIPQLKGGILIALGGVGGRGIPPPPAP